MFIDNRILNKLQSCESIDEILQFLYKNKNMVLAFKTELFAIINKINSERMDVSLNIDFLKYFYFNKNEVNKNDFDIVKMYCDNTFQYLKYIQDNIPEVMQALFIMMLSKDNIIKFENRIKTIKDDKTENLTFWDSYTNMTKNLYLKILDLYVPCENPEEVVSTILRTGKSLGDLLQIAYNDEEFKKCIYVCQEPSDHHVCTEIIFLFKYLCELYYVEEVKVDTFYNYHYMVTKSIPLVDKVDEIEQRYLKYFKDETLEIIYNLLLMFNQSGIEVKLKDFIGRINEEFSINVKILESLLRDILELSCTFNDPIRNRNNVKLIETLCDSKLNELKMFKPGSPDIIEEDYHKVIPSVENIYKYSSPATEAYKKDSVVMHDTQNHIYRAYKNYKNAEDKIDSQVTKAVTGMKGVLIGDVKTEIIEGKKFSAIKLLKEILGTAAIFAFGPIKAVVLLVVRYALKKSTTLAEKKKIILELEAELEMVNEKIEDARGDGNKPAKYALMRTRTELTTALNRIKYGIAADERSTNTAKSTIKDIRSKL